MKDNSMARNAGNLNQEVMSEPPAIDEPDGEFESGQLEGYRDLHAIESDDDYEEDDNEDDEDYEDDGEEDEDEDQGRVSLEPGKNNNAVKEVAGPRTSLAVRPAFHSRAVQLAQKSAVRSQFNKENAFLLNDEDDIAARPVNKKSGFRRRKRDGSTDANSPYHKKITKDLDSDDELMMTMREKGYTDQQIADRLTREGRVRYDRKSICTRIARVKQAQAAYVDKLLEEGYKEWEIEDDNLLIQAYELADIEVKYDIERIRAWRYRKVSEQMRRLNKDAIFSETACRERYKALMNGTAKIPTRVDDEPEVRRMEAEAARKERERIREAEEAELEKKREIERKIKEEARIRNAEKAEQTAKRRAAKAKEKADRAMKRAATQQMRLQRAHENKMAKIAKHQDVKAAKARLAKMEREANRSPHMARVVDPCLDLARVTKDTPDPRSILSLEDLQSLCRDRGLCADGEVQEVFLDRLRTSDDLHTLQQLKVMCRAKGLNAIGTKHMLKYQLALAEARLCPSFEAGMKAQEKLQGDENVVEEEKDEQPQEPPAVDLNILEFS